LVACLHGMTANNTSLDWGDCATLCCQKRQTKIVDASLTLTFDGWLFCLNVIPLLWTANITCLGKIIFIQKHGGLSDSEPQQFASSVRWMTSFRQVIPLSAGMLRHTEPLTTFRQIEPDFLTFLVPAGFLWFPLRSIWNYQQFDYVQQGSVESYTVSYMN
jgi:hypothetical protein